MIHAFDALVHLCISIGEHPIKGWGRNSHLTQLMTYQLFREITNTTEPGMGNLSPRALEIKANPHLRKIVETPVCKRFLGGLQERCIKPYIIDAVLQDNDALQVKLLHKAEELRRIAKNGGSEEMGPIQLFDSQGIIRNSYVIQALREEIDGKKLWDHICDTPELRFLRKDAGEFSALSAVTSSVVEQNARVVLVTRDAGAKNLFEAAYAGNIEEHIKGLKNSRGKDPKAENLLAKDIFPYEQYQILKNNRSPIIITNEIGFLNFCCEVEQALRPHAKTLRSMKEKKNNDTAPSILEALNNLKEANAAFFEMLHKGRTQKKKKQEPERVPKKKKHSEEERDTEEKLFETQSANRLGIEMILEIPDQRQGLGATRKKHKSRDRGA